MTFQKRPFFDKYISLYFPHADWEIFPGLYTGDFRTPTSEGHFWDFVVKTNVTQAEVILTMATVQNLPEEWDIVLLDKASQVAINFSTKKKYTFPSGAKETMREFRIAVGRPEFIEKNDLNLDSVPQDYALSQNYPNPFNPRTHLKYELPTASQVKITVFNLNGQRVRILFDGKKNAGRYVASWNGSNTAGRRVASGVYFVRMKAERFVTVRKMILTK